MDQIVLLPFARLLDILALQLFSLCGCFCAGKTTLLTTLTGKSGPGVVSGTVLVNGEEDTLEQYRHVMGFVPQSDTMHANQTVEENLLFSARYRLPDHFKHSDHRGHVERAIQVLCVLNLVLAHEFS